MKILITDDSLAWRNFHKNIIEEVLFEIEEKGVIDLAISARDGYESVKTNINTPYDLIISDLQMEDDFEPKYAGEWFIEQIKTLKSYRNTKIIISSGCRNIKHTAEILSVDYIPKSEAVSDINAYKTKLMRYLK